jgi:hypothetical protein
MTILLRWVRRCVLPTGAPKHKSRETGLRRERFHGFGDASRPDFKGGWRYPCPAPLHKGLHQGQLALRRIVLCSSAGIIPIGSAVVLRFRVRSQPAPFCTYDIDRGWVQSYRLRRST